MFLLPFHVQGHFDRLRQLADRLRRRFEIETDPTELLLDAKELQAQLDRLDEDLPAGLPGGANLSRHVRFLDYYLSRGSPENCRSDIADICERDIDECEQAFREWWTRLRFLDSELADALADLVAESQLDSAIRKSFIVLKHRLCGQFHISSDIDGADLVNRIFGKSGSASELLDQRTCSGSAETGVSRLES